MANCDICNQEITDNAVQHDSLTLHEACQARLEAYNDKVQRRYERLSAAAERAEKEAHSLHDHAHTMASGIPFGQPILVGHHSEKRDRNYRAKIERTYRKSFEQFKRAENLERRAKAAKQNRAISSDDPAAVIELKEKLTHLEELQARMVEINKAVQAVTRSVKHTPEQKAQLKALETDPRRRGTMDQMNAVFHEKEALKKALTDQYPALAPKLAELAKITEARALELLTPDFAGRIGFPDYAIKNNGANMRRIKQRIEDLTRQQEKVISLGNEITKYTGRITMTINREENRVQLEFPGKPAASTIALLKGAGFHWSPSGKVWQRMISADAIFYAHQILFKVGAMQMADVDYWWQGDTNVYPFDAQEYTPETPQGILSDTDWCAELPGSPPLPDSAPSAAIQLILF